MDLKEKVVLITGASSGIGAATAVYLAGLGARLAITGRNVVNLQKTEDECIRISNGIKPLSIVADMVKDEDIPAIVEETIKKYGRLDVLVNNAAIANVGSVETITLEKYDEVMNTNVRSVLILTKLCLPHLIESKGNVINVSSVLGIRPNVDLLSYCMAKAALDQFTRCLALEVAQKQVRVNTINPGAVDTDIYRRAGAINEEFNSKDFFAAISKLHPMGRVAEAREIATVIAFLASDLASNITGINLPIDGGLLISTPTIV